MTLDGENVLPLPPRRLMQQFLLTNKKLLGGVGLHWPCGYAPQTVGLSFLGSILLINNCQRLITLTLVAASRAHNGDVCSQRVLYRLGIVTRQSWSWWESLAHNLPHKLHSQTVSLVNHLWRSSTNVCTRGKNILEIPFIGADVPVYSHPIRQRLAGWCFPPETLIVAQSTILGASLPEEILCVMGLPRTYGSCKRNAHQHVPGRHAGSI